MNTTSPVILSLGGSLIYPHHGIDTAYLRQFASFIRMHVAAGRRFFIVCGGGNVARHYQNIASRVTSLAPEDVDWLGIHATRINGHLVRTVFSDIAHPRVVENYRRRLHDLNEPVVIAGGWKPGWSTDYCATVLARDYGAKTIINLSNIDMLFNKDPKKYKDARPIEEITWDEFTKYSGDKWTPGANVPFDPIASKLAKKLGLTVIIANGKNLDNLDRILTNQSFIGTTIQPFKLEPAFFNQAYFQGRKGEFGSRFVRGLNIVRRIYRAIIVAYFLRAKKVLDVGCGTGQFVGILRKLGLEAWGIDSSSYAVNHALPQVKEYIRAGDVRALLFPDNSFDLVTSFDVLEHLPKADIPKAASECTRVSSHLQLHKIYTKENTWLHKIHGYDPSHVSVLEQKWWENLWKKNKLQMICPWWLRLPRAISTMYLLRK